MNSRSCQKSNNIKKIHEISHIDSKAHWRKEACQNSKGESTQKMWGGDQPS